MAKWGKVMTALGTSSPALTCKEDRGSISLAGAEPELCITLLTRGLNFRGLMDRLRSADQDWMEHFLSLGGLSAIFDSLESLCAKGFSGIADALKQLDCVNCVKAVMNNKFGLEFIIAQPGEGFVKKLTQVLDTNNVLVKMQIFELLSGLCIYSEGGYSIALDALQDYKRTKALRYRFSLLIQEIKGAETEEHVASVLALVNCIIAGAPDLSARVKIRNELVGLQLTDVLLPWKHSTHDDLATQIDVFEESTVEDNAHLDMPGGINLNSHEDIFNALLAKFSATPHATPMLHLLQNLLLVEREGVKSCAVWSVMESVSQQVVLMEDPASQEAKLTDVSLDKIRAALQEEQNRAHQAVSIPVPAHTSAPPPPPPAAAPPPPPPPPPAIPGAPPPPPPPGIPGAPPPPPPPGIPGAPPPPPPPGIPGAPPPPPPPGIPGAPPPPPPPGIPGAPPPPPPPGVPGGGVPPPPPFPGGGVPPPPPFPGGGVPPPPGVPSFPGAAMAAAGARRLTKFEAARHHKPAKPMKKLNWVKVSQRQACSSGTLWARSHQGTLDTKVDIDFHQVEELFSRAEVKKAKKGSDEADGAEGGKPKQPSVVSLLDQKTSLNVNIFLKQFKMDNGSLVAMFQDGDTSRISMDQLKALEKLLPDSGQIETLKSYSGDRALLGTAEDFFIRLLAVKQYAVRIEAMQLSLEFREKVADIKPSIALLDTAMEEVLSCDKLTELFHVALIAGNVINGGGRAGDAYGFTIESLSKLKDTKANKPRMSLLHYIAQVCEDQHPELLHILESLPHLEKATRLSHEFLSGQVAELNKKVKELDKKVKKKDSPDDLKAQLKSFLAEGAQTLEDLKDSLGAVTKKMNSMADYFCQDSKKFKLEELFAALLNFLRELENAQKENVQRAVLEQKKLKREAAKKAADEAKRKKAEAKGDQGASKVGVAPEPEEDGCIIDNLLKEIRAGTTLKSTGRKGTIRKKSSLSSSDLGKLNTMLAKAASVTPRQSRAPSEDRDATDTHSSSKMTLSPVGGRGKNDSKRKSITMEVLDEVSNTLESLSEPQAKPTQEPRDKPSQEPQAKPTQESQDKTSQEPQAKPTQESQDKHSQEPQAKYSQEPQDKPSLEPQANTSLESQASPSAEPQGKPSSEFTSDAGAKLIPDPVIAQKSTPPTEDTTPIVGKTTPSAGNVTPAMPQAECVESEEVFLPPTTPTPSAIAGTTPPISTPYQVPATNSQPSVPAATPTIPALSDTVTASSGSATPTIAPPVSTPANAASSNGAAGILATPTTSSTVSTTPTDMPTSKATPTCIPVTSNGTTSNGLNVNTTFSQTNGVHSTAAAVTPAIPSHTHQDLSRVQAATPATPTTPDTPSTANGISRVPVKDSISSEEDIQPRAMRSDSENAILAQIQEQLSTTRSFFQGLAAISALSLIMVPQAANHMDEVAASGDMPPLPERQKSHTPASRKASRGDPVSHRKRSTSSAKSRKSSSSSQKSRKGSRDDPLTPRQETPDKEVGPSSRKSATLDKKTRKELKQAAKKSHSKSTKIKSKSRAASSSE